MKGIEPEARETAKDAARRAGLTLGQWLNQKILDSGEGEQPMQDQARREGGRDTGERDDAFEARLESLSRRLDRFSVQPPSAGERRLQAPLGALESRLNRTDAQVGALQDDVDRLADRFEQVAAKSGEQTMSALERALTNVVDHIELTDRRNGEVLKTIQARLSELAARTPTASDLIDGKSRAAILALEDRIGDLAERIESADRAPVFDPTSFDRKLASLAQKIDTIKQGSPSGPAIEHLDNRVAQLASKLLTTERVMAAQTDVNALRSEVGKLRDDLSRAREPSKPAVVQALESRLNTVSSEVAALRSSAAPSSALNSLNSRLEHALSRLEKTETAAKTVSRIGNLEQGLADLAERLDRAVKAEADPRVDPRIAALEHKVDEIASRFADSAQHSAPLPALQELEEQVAAIAERLNSTEQHFSALRSIESSLEQLYESIDSTRNAAIDAAEQAAFNAMHRSRDAQANSHDIPQGDALSALERGLAEVKAQTSASDARTQETLEAIHDTLRRVIDRLGALEESANKPSAAKPGIQSETGATDEFGGSVGFGEFRLPPMPDFSVQPVSPQVNAKPPVTTDIDHGESATVVVGEPRPVDTAATESAEDEDASEFAQAYDAPAPAAPRNEDFIAAARRAAQAANEGADGSARRGREDGDNDSNGQGGLFRGRRRTLLFAAAALFLIAGALSVSGLLGRGSGKGVVPAVSSMLAPTEQTQEPAAASDQDEEATPAQNAANYFGTVDRIDGGPPNQTARSVQPSEKPVPTDRPGERITSAKQDGGAAGETVFAPSATKADGPPSEIAATPATQPAIASPPAADSATKIENIGQREADGEMMTAMAIDPAPAEQRDILPPSVDSALAAAAAAGDPRAQFEIGARFADGRAGEKSAAKAVRWYQRAAAQGLAPAQYRLGALYEKGQGVPADKQAARIWYQRAAEQGNVKAMHNLAVLLAGGVNGTPDYARAARWFVKAAEFGLADSQFNLAVLHERGLGVERDPVAAYKWFAIAASAGDTEADSRMDTIAASLDGATLARASSAAKSWTAKSIDRNANIVESSYNSSSATGQSVAPAHDGDRTIARAQQILAVLGYDPGPADGLSGPRTVNAVVAFERDRGLPETGAITPELVELLEAAIAG